MVRKGNLAIFESSNISKSGEGVPTKIGVHAYYINPYLHEFFELILFFDPTEGSIYWSFTYCSGLTLVLTLIHLNLQCISCLWTFESWPMHVEIIAIMFVFALKFYELTSLLYNKKN